MSTVNKTLSPCKRKRPNSASISEEDADVRRIRRIRQLPGLSALKTEKKKPGRKPKVTKTVLLQPPAQPDIKRKLGPGSSARRIAWSRFELQRFKSVSGQSAGSVQAASPTLARPAARPGTVNIKPNFSRSGSHGNSNDNRGTESSGSLGRDRLSDGTADEDSDSDISLQDYVEVDVPRATPILSTPASPIHPYSRPPSRPPSHRGSVAPLVDYSSSDDEIPPILRSPGRHPSARVISDNKEFLQNVTLHNVSLVMPPPPRPIPGKIKYMAWPLSLNGPGSNRILARKKLPVERSISETRSFCSMPSVETEINESPIKFGVMYIEDSPSLCLASTGYSRGEAVEDTVIEDSMVVEDTLVLDDEHRSQYTAGKGDDKGLAFSPQVDESICNVTPSSQSNPAQDTISVSTPRPCHGPAAITSSEPGTPAISSNPPVAFSTDSTSSQDTRPQPTLQGAVLSSVTSRTLLLTPQSGVRSVLGPPLAALDLTGRSSPLLAPAKSSTSSVLCAPFTEIPGQPSPDVLAASSSCACQGATIPSSFSASIFAKNPLSVTNYSHNASTPHNRPSFISLPTPATARANGSQALPWSFLAVIPPENLPTLSQVQQIQAKKQEEQIKMARLIVQRQQLNQSSLRLSVDPIVPLAPLKSNGPWNRELEKPIQLPAERHKLPDGPVIKKTTVKEVIEIFGDGEDENMADVATINDAAGDEDQAMVDQAAASEMVQDTGTLATAGKDLEQTHNPTVSGMNVSLVCAPVVEPKSRSKSTNQIPSSSVGMLASLSNPGTTAIFCQSSRDDSKSSPLCVFTGVLYNCPPTTRKVYHSSRPSLHMEPRKSPSIKNINLTHSPHKASFRLDILDFLIYNQSSSSHPPPPTVPFTSIYKDFPRQSVKFYRHLISPGTTPSFTANPHIAWNFPTHKDNGEPEGWYVRQQLGERRCWRKRPYCGALVMASRPWRGGRGGLGNDGLGPRFSVGDWQGRAWASPEKEEEWGFVVPRGLRDRSRWGDDVLLGIFPESNCIK